MSSKYPLINCEGIDPYDSIGENVEVLHAEMTSIHCDLTSTAERRDDGEEIITVGLEGVSDQSAVRINVHENIPFAGGDGNDSILSILFGAQGIFGYLNIID